MVLLHTRHTVVRPARRSRTRAPRTRRRRARDRRPVRWPASSGVADACRASSASSSSSPVAVGGPAAGARRPTTASAPAPSSTPWFWSTWGNPGSPNKSGTGGDTIETELGERRRGWGLLCVMEAGDEIERRGGEEGKRALDESEGVVVVVVVVVQSAVGDDDLNEPDPSFFFLSLALSNAPKLHQDGVVPGNLIRPSHQEKKKPLQLPSVRANRDGKRGTPCGWACVRDVAAQRARAGGKGDRIGMDRWSWRRSGGSRPLSVGCVRAM